MNAIYILTLSDPTTTLETVGGKGLSLARLSEAGFPVPGGFHITTAAYRQFVAENELQPQITAALDGVDPNLPASLELASEKIRGFFAKGEIPGEIEEAICEAYAGLENPARAVAVRSSATAEDLPEASFAGQQETYLNIRGAEAVIEAVKNCWASLWTGRAIAYRLKNQIDQQAVALAVVVQELVPAEAAGILFTANPVNGRRDEMVINAAWGLGEAIVGGLVTPDTIVADKATGKIKHTEVADKAVLTVTTQAGTAEQPLTGPRRNQPVLTAAQVAQLVHLGKSIEAFYGSPQDIEWCWADGHFAIVQARPITTLPETEAAVAEWKLPKGAYAAMRNNIVELMTAPLSPLFASLGRTAINHSLHRVLDSSGMGWIMPGEIIITVNQFAYFNGSVSARGMVRMLFGMRKILKVMFTGAVERWTEDGRPRYTQIVDSWQAKDWQKLSATELVHSAQQLTEAAIDAYGALISGIIPGAWMTEAIFTKVYNLLIKRRSDPQAPTYLLGFASLPIRADQALFDLASWARAYPALREYLANTPAARLAQEAGPAGEQPAEVPGALWEEWQTRFGGYLRTYGNSLYDLDFAHPLPVDDPRPVLETLKLYLHGQGTNPHIRQEESADRRERATAEQRKRLKGLRLRWFNQTLAVAQKYAPLREEGLAEIGLAYPLVRKMFGEVGRRLAETNAIGQADDVYWLEETELLEAAARLEHGLRAEPLTKTVEKRKAQHAAALRLKPPMALPQMKMFGVDLMALKEKRKHKSKGDLIQGVAASPGTVTGQARVLHGPEEFSQMQPGEVLVAEITTPAWTPLFALASGIVTDVGGPLSHGSIVAREYGIPAVLGTGVATKRIQSGQTITVDGAAGKVLLSKRGE